MPYKIKYNERIFEYAEEIKWYLRDDMKCELSNSKKCLNDEVEIIEEDKKIEKLETYKEIDDEEHYANILKVSKNGEYEINEALSVVVDKINEIIDYINKEDK